MIEDQALRPITQAFRQKYPFIEPEFWRADTRDLINKALAEARARAVVGDIIEGGGVSQALIKAGAVQAFSTPALAPYAKERYDSKGLWAATRVSYFGLAYNTQTGEGRRRAEDLSRRCSIRNGRASCAGPRPRKPAAP